MAARQVQRCSASQLVALLTVLLLVDTVCT
jgi:hypothetical protein